MELPFQELIWNTGWTQGRRLNCLLLKKERTTSFSSCSLLFLFTLPIFSALYFLCTPYVVLYLFCWLNQVNPLSLLLLYQWACAKLAHHKASLNQLTHRGCCFWQAGQCSWVVSIQLSQEEIQSTKPGWGTMTLKSRQGGHTFFTWMHGFMLHFYAHLNQKDNLKYAVLYT